MSRINRFIWFLIMIIIGGGIGLYYSWYVKPADFVDAALYNMRPDYKTDYVQKGEEKKLVDKYKKQLDLYKEALENALNRKVDKVLIYSTWLGEIEIKEN